MDDDQTPINAKKKRRRQLPSAVEGAAMGFEEKVLWRAGDAARAAADACRRLFETLAWALRRWIVWPLQDRVPLLDRSGRVLVACGLFLIVASVGGVAVLTGSSGSSAEPTSAPVAISPAPAPEPQPAPAPESETATLKGAAPVFEPPAPRGASKLDRAEPIEPAPAQGSDSGTAAAASSSAAATDTISSSPTNGPGAAGASASASTRTATPTGPPAGPAAVAVAREFADAFVVYETGGGEAEVRKALATTATPELARSLLRRPPRLPANVEVPKAKVVNVVPGPSTGGIYSMSVSLLRVGLTSELRLDMEKLKDGGWRVTNVLG